MPGKQTQDEIELSLEFPLVMVNGLLDALTGSSARTSPSLLLEPAFVASNDKSDTSSSAFRSPLYFAQPSCAALDANDANTLAQVGQAITNMTGVPVLCVSLPAVW